MKILFDHQIFTNQKFGGISRYFFELINRFDGVDDSYEVTSLLSNNEYYNKNVNPKVKSFFHEQEFKGKIRIQSLVNKMSSIKQLNNKNFDVFHPTYYNPYFLKKLKNKPFILTFHDAINEKFGSEYPELGNDISLLKFKKTLLDKANKIIAVSENTKKDIIEYYNIDHNKIEVIHLGNSLSNINNCLPKVIEQDYILFVGNRGNYKNFIFFINSISHLLLKYKLKLICAGGGDFNREEYNVFVKLNIQDIIIYKPILNDNVLVNLYQHALFFCFPSLYEGFGIPVLESFSSNCPILLSNGGSLTEVGSDAALYFDPKNSDSLIYAFETLVTNDHLRNELKTKGFERSKHFNWNKTFEKHIEIYKSII
jgi:glycosyltransferase involved in cell wall biosynthesis